MARSGHTQGAGCHRCGARLTDAPSGTHSVGMRSPGPLPPHLRDRPFTTAAALSAGVNAGRLRANDLNAPFHGVRQPEGSTDTAGSLASAYAAKMPPRAFFSHGTAAALWGIPIPFRDRLTHVGTIPGSPMPRGTGVRGHRLQVDPTDIVTRDGLRLTSQARTWCDLSTVLSGEDLVAAGDYLLWRRRFERVTRADLAEAVSRYTGRRGRPALDVAFPLLSDSSDSRPESVFRFRTIQDGLPEPLPNFPIYDDRNTFVAQPDLVFVDYRVCFDYEGEHHFTDQAQWSKDLGRVRRIEDAGWSHVRAGKTDLRDSRAVFATLRTRLRARGWPG